MNIGASSEASGVSQRMIRHYEKIGLIPAPPRRDSGYRDYSDDDVHRLRFIANARDLGFPVEEIRSLFGLWSDSARASTGGAGVAPCGQDRSFRSFILETEHVQPGGRWLSVDDECSIWGDLN